MKPLIYWLVALQLLLSAPVVSALTASGTHCAAFRNHCPCCPDGVVGMADCLSACSAAAAPPPVCNAVIAEVASSEAPAQAVRRLDTLDEPPLKPPPIL